MKTCTKCRVEKDLKEFHGRSLSTDGRQFICKQCNVLRARRQSLYRDREWVRLRIKLSAHRITVDQYYALCESQDWQCALCHRDFDGREHIDHSHATGRVRGVLCASCNTALGKLQERVDVMQRAIAYVSRCGLTPRERVVYGSQVA